MPKNACTERSRSGFTLVELLVVITIMGLIGIYTLSNYKSFGEDQKLKSALLDIQSQLRTAQTNATANTICNNNSKAIWQIVYTNTATVTTANLNCQELPLPSPVPTPIFKKNWQLGTNVSIQGISGTGSSCPATLSLPLTITFDSLTGKIGFGDPGCSALTITLINSKTNSTKALVIEQGGRIYEQ